MQTANGLPRGFAQGTVTYAQVQPVRRFFAGHAVRRAASAQRTIGSHS